MRDGKRTTSYLMFLYFLGHQHVHHQNRLLCGLGLFHVPLRNMVELHDTKKWYVRARHVEQGDALKGWPCGATAPADNVGKCGLKFQASEVGCKKNVWWVACYLRVHPSVQLTTARDFTCDKTQNHPGTLCRLCTYNGHGNMHTHNLNPVPPRFFFLRKK